MVFASIVRVGRRCYNDVRRGDDTTTLSRQGADVVAPRTRVRRLAGIAIGTAGLAEYGFATESVTYSLYGHATVRYAGVPALAVNVAIAAGAAASLIAVKAAVPRLGS